MKKNITLVLVLCMVLGQSTSLFSQKKLGKFKLDEMMSQDPDGDGKSKIQSIMGAMEWRNNLLKDENGNFDPAYQIRAAQQAKQVSRNASQRSVNLQWEELGPSNIGGRTRSILYDNRDTSRKTIYAGAVGGGLWKSTDGAENWSRVTSLTSNVAVSCIAQDVNGIIYFGTGEGLSQPNGSSRNSGIVGNGLHMLYGNDQDSILPSTIPSNISNSVQWCEINRLAINPTDPQDIFAATSGGNSGGLMHSTDRGQTWILVGQGINNQITGLTGGYQSAADVKFSADGFYVFASVGQSSYSPGAHFILSQDGGQTFYALPTNLLPQYPAGVVRIEIGVAPSNPMEVYIVVAAGASGTGAYIYNSQDAGNTWTQIGSPGGVLNAPFGTDGQGFYDIAISVSPFDADKVYFGGTQVYSYTSLTGWQLASIYFGDASVPQWVHADVHTIVFNDKHKDEMFIGCDGGVFKSSNAYTGFPTPDYSAKNRGYAVTQNYSVAADMTGSAVGGAQDNGTNYVDYLNGGTTYASQVYGGDGVYAEISHFDPNFFVGGYVGGNDFRSSTKGVAWVDLFDAIMDPKGWKEPSACGQGTVAGQLGNAPFVTAFWLEETKTAFNSVDSVSFSDTLTHYAGETLNLISHIKQPYQVTLTDSVQGHTVAKFVDPLKSRLYFAASCGLWMTPDILDFGNTPRWFRITASSDDVKSLTSTPSGDTIYFGGNSKMQRMTGMNSVLFDTAHKGHKDIIMNTNSGFTAFTSTVTTSGRYIEGMDVDRNDPTHVLAAVAGYSSAGAGHVYESTDAGATWAAVGAGILPNMPVYQCVIDAYNSDHYIVGTELGVWDSYDRGQSWSEQNGGLEVQLPVYRLRQQTYLSDQCYALYIGTHGRGMWRSTTLTSASPYGCSVNALGIKDHKDYISNMLVYPNPVTGGNSNVVLELSQSATATLRVIDMPGRLLQETTYNNLVTGKNELSLNTSNLANGTYLVIGTLSSGQTMTRTIVVAR
jgi:photosystem II stability/assembly factor-like uncharacterized protein